MNSEGSKGHAADQIDGSISERPPGNAVDVRVPPRRDYLAVLRSVVGVLAGNASFSYDDILELRVAVSDAFDLATRQHPGGGAKAGDALTVRFIVGADDIQVLLAKLEGAGVPVDGDADLEKRALLESVMDVVEFGSGPAETWSIRMVKRRST